MNDNEIMGGIGIGYDEFSIPYMSYTPHIMQEPMGRNYRDDQFMDSYQAARVSKSPYYNDRMSNVINHPVKGIKFTKKNPVFCRDPKSLDDIYFSNKLLFDNISNLTEKSEKMATEPSNNNPI